MGLRVELLHEPPCSNPGSSSQNANLEPTRVSLFYNIFGKSGALVRS